MRRREFLTLAVVLMVAVAAAAAQRPAGQPPRDAPARDQQSTPQNGGITGRVVDSATGRALPKAKVTLSSDAGAPPAPLFTDTNGGFAFAPLPAARYTMLVEKTGFARVRYGARTELDPPVEIDLTDGAHTENVVVRLTKGAAIYGRVTDDFGDPVVGGQISLDALQIIGASQRLVPATHVLVETDDLGDYRIGDLAPGRYYVSVAGAGLGTLPSGMPREWERLVAWVRTYFPGATARGDATPIAVAAGEERGGVDFSVRPFSRINLALTVSGFAAPSLPARGSPRVVNSRLRLSFIPVDAADAADVRTFTMQRSFTASPGEPAPLPGILGMNPPVGEGDWIVLAREGPNGALARIRLASGDDTALSLDLAPGAKLSGRVVWDGARPAAMNAVKLFFHGSGDDAAIPPDLLTPVPITLRADGTFDVSGLFGTVAPDIVPPPGWTVKAVLLGQRDLLDDPLTLESGEAVAGVQVVLSDHVASLTGTASLTDGSPASGCAIALFPDDAAVRVSPRRMRLARADQHGRFRLRDVPSGPYRIVAASDIEAATWMTAESIAALRGASSAIAVPQGGAQEIALTCQAGP